MDERTRDHRATGGASSAGVWRLIAEFSTTPRIGDDELTYVKNAGKSPHTVRGYRSDLLQFVAHHDGDIGEPAAAPIRAYLADVTKALNTICSRRPRKDVLLDRLRDRVLFASSPT